MCVPVSVYPGALLKFLDALHVTRREKFPTLWPVEESWLASGACLISMKCKAFKKIISIPWCKTSPRQKIFFFNFCSDKSPFCGAILFRTSVDSAHGFQSQGGSIIICALLLLARNDPQSQLCISRPRPVPIFTPWYDEATAGVTAQRHFWNNWQRQDSNPGPHGPKPCRCSTDWAIPASVTCHFPYMPNCPSGAKMEWIFIPFYPCR